MQSNHPRLSGSRGEGQIRNCFHERIMDILPINEAIKEKFEEIEEASEIYV
jgi:hypothetical protein